MKSKNTYSEAELKEKAQPVLDAHKQTNEVYATTDGNVFLLKNRAELHAGEGRVICISRPLQKAESSAPKNEMTAKETIKHIEEAEDFESIARFADDDGKTVQAAYTAKLEELGGPSKDGPEE